MEQIPNLGETDDTPLEEKMIHKMYRLDTFVWMMAEYDPEKRLFFGYANLGCDRDAEWGYISLDELESVNAIQVEMPQPISFPLCHRVWKAQR